MGSGCCLAKVDEVSQENLVFLSSRFGREFIYLEDGAKEMVEEALIDSDGWLWIDFDQLTGMVKEVYSSWVAT